MHSVLRTDKYFGHEMTHSGAMRHYNLYSCSLLLVMLNTRTSVSSFSIFENSHSGWYLSVANSSAFFPPSLFLSLTLSLSFFQHISPLNLLAYKIVGPFCRKNTKHFTSETAKLFPMLGASSWKCTHSTDAWRFAHIFNLNLSGSSVWYSTHKELYS